MANLHIQLFGIPLILCHGRAVAGLEARKVLELFCYLLLYRERPHSRESLANVLWSNISTTQSKKYLRQTLWQLQAALNQQKPSAGDNCLIVAESDYVHSRLTMDAWLDIALFEETFNRVQGVAGRNLDAVRFQSLRDAVNLYRGDLLIGWYQDWCLYERERYENMYLAMLDKLMDYCEAHREYELGLHYGDQALKIDPARERAHRRLMRLHCAAGDRTAALRQYTQCADALRRELAVKPSKRTIELHEQIRAELLPNRQQPPSPGGSPTSQANPPWSDMLTLLKQIQTALAGIQAQIQHEIQAGAQAIDPRSE